MSTTPMDSLELRAVEQRQQLHARASELKWKVEETRENLSPAKQSREHFTKAAAIASVVGLLAGYAFTGMFTAK